MTTDYDPTILSLKHQLDKVTAERDALQSLVDFDVLSDQCGWRFMKTSLHDYQQHRLRMFGAISDDAKAKVEERKRQIVVEFAPE